MVHKRDDLVELLLALAVIVIDDRWRSGGIDGATFVHPVRNLDGVLLGYRPRSTEERRDLLRNLRHAVVLSTAQLPPRSALRVRRDGHWDEALHTEWRVITFKNYDTPAISRRSPRYATLFFPSANILPT